MTVPGKVFAKTEVMIPFTCDVHPWISSYVGVVEHPFFAVSSAEGSYEITSLSAGICGLTVWHETLADGAQKVEVRYGVNMIDLEFHNKPRMDK